MKNRSARSSSGKKRSKYHVVVYNNNSMSFDYVIEAFQTILGCDHTQAANSANIIHLRGEYIVKTYPDKEYADAAFEYLCEAGFRCDVLEKK